MSRKKNTHEPTESYRARLELRKSNAAVPHDSRPNRERTREDARRAALKDWD